MILFDKDRLAGKKILIIGDVMLDRHIWGEVERISPEAPVPVVDVRRDTSVPGGASNVANNVAGLGASAVLIGVTGDDVHGEELRELLLARGIDISGMIMDEERPTTVKTRVIAHNQHVVRIDRESRKPMGPKLLGRIKDKIREIAGNIDGVIIEDYGKGLITGELISEVIGLFSAAGVPVAVDPKEAHYPIYKGVSVMTPNHHEAGGMYGTEITDRASLIRVGDGIMKDLALKALIITLGKDGMTLFEESGAVSHVPTVAKEEFDVTGAGDTVIATLTAMLAAGYSYSEAAFVSNVAAGIVVETPGVVPIDKTALFERLKDERLVVNKIRG